MISRLPWQGKYLALALIWGSSFLLIMVGLRAFDPIQLAWVRLLTGAGVLLVLLYSTGGRLPRAGRVWLDLAVSGFILTAFPFTMFAVAEQYIPSALAGIANSTTPLFAVLLGMLVLPDQALSRVQSAALALGFLGVVVILQPWRVEGRPDLGGFAIALAASASYAVGWTYVRRRLTADDVGGLALPTGQVLCGAMQLTLAVVLWWALAPGSAATGWHPNGHLLPALLAVTTLGALGTGVAMAFQFDVVRQVGPTIATTVTYLIPVVAVAMGHLVLGEGLSGVQLLGAGVVLASAVLLGLPRRTMADDGEEG